MSYMNTKNITFCKDDECDWQYIVYTTKLVNLSNVCDYVILFIFVPRVIFEIKWSVLLKINFHLVFVFQYSTFKTLSKRNCSNNWTFGETSTHNTERGTIKFDFVETSPPN